MALEASDLNDGTILQQTRQNTDARGNIQFEITLPSGRLLKSEFINKDNARKALFAWIESVKEQAVADSNAERLERAAKSKRAGKMDIERRPGDDQPLFRAGGARVDDGKSELMSVPAGQADLDKDGLPLGYGDGPNPNRVVPTETMEPAFSPNPDSQPKVIIPTVSGVMVDPLEFAKAQYDIQAKRVAELKDAERKLWQWTVIIETLEEKDRV